MPPRTTQQSHRPRVRESQIEPWLAYSLEASDATECRVCSNLEVPMESNNAPANHNRGRSQGLDVGEHPRRNREKYFSLDVPFYRTRRAEPPTLPKSREGSRAQSEPSGKAGATRLPSMTNYSEREHP